MLWGKESKMGVPKGFWKHSCSNIPPAVTSYVPRFGLHLLLVLFQLIYIYNILGVCLSRRPPWGLGLARPYPFFFLLNMWRFQNSFFFPSWKCGDLIFFLEIFQNARFTMYVFMGDFLMDFCHKNIYKINKISCFVPLCVCLSVAKQLWKFCLF